MAVIMIAGGCVHSPESIMSLDDDVGIQLIRTVVAPLTG